MNNRLKKGDDEDDKKYGPSLDTDRKIAAYRDAVKHIHSKGGMTDEEKAVATGNLDEAAAKNRLRLPRN